MRWKKGYLNIVIIGFLAVIFLLTGFCLREIAVARSQIREFGTDGALEAYGALNRVTVSALLILIVVLALVTVFYICVLLPLMRYVRELGHVSSDTDLILKPCGFWEMQTFARMFNSVYADWQRQRRKLERMNAIDTLTGISNRATLDEYVKGLISAGEKDIGLLMMDVDNFKSFNDGYGHLVGDQVLIRMGKCFDRIAEKEGGIAGRLGGEEFIIVIPDAGAARLEQIAFQVMEAVRAIRVRELGIPDSRVHITVSVGSTVWRRGRRGDLNALIHQADMALYRAKARGKNQHIMFSEYEDAFILMEYDKRREKEVESEMYSALKQREFVPFFQPKYDLETGEICGAEALARWNHRQKGYLYPDYFVPVLEKDGFITRIDFAMFEELCESLRSWKEEGIPLVSIACNFSRLHLGKGTLVPRLLEITGKYEVSPSLIQVEVTESGIMEKTDIALVRKEFEALRAAGFTIAIDDFGTGYSSLGMLQELPADVLKVDKSFVQQDLKLRENELMLNGILYIAHVMNLDTVAEGVETKEQADLLRRLGYRVVQGYYFSKPVEKERFREMIKKAGAEKRQGA